MGGGSLVGERVDGGWLFTVVRIGGRERERYSTVQYSSASAILYGHEYSYISISIMSQS